MTLWYQSGWNHAIASAVADDWKTLQGDNRGDSEICCWLAPAKANAH
jgi:hypothetical protein